MLLRREKARQSTEYLLKMESKKDLIIELYGDTDDVVFADGLDDAIIGFEPNLWKVVYSRSMVIEILTRDGMTEEEAVEYAEYNTFGAYIGDKTPIWVEDFKWN
jgi:hypothetical protein